MEESTKPSPSDLPTGRIQGAAASLIGVVVLGMLLGFAEAAWISESRLIPLDTPRWDAVELGRAYAMVFATGTLVLWILRPWKSNLTPNQLLASAAALWVIPYQAGWGLEGSGMVVLALATTWAYGRLPRILRFLMKAAALMLGAAWFCGWLDRADGPLHEPAEGVKLPNVVLVVIDTLRADHLGCYGHEPEGFQVSPEIDALAARGTLFENALAQAPWTRPSTASLFSSLYPASHRIVTPYDPLGADIPTLATMLSERGYRTAAFSANPQVSPAFGFHHGFQHFWSSTSDLGSHSAGARLTRRWGTKLGLREKAEQGHRGVAHSTADDVNAAVAAWAASADEEPPTFLYVHYLDPHDPYEAPQDLLGMEVRASVAEEPLYASQELPPYPLEGSSLVDLEEEAMRELKRRYDTEIRFVDNRLAAMLQDLEERGLYSEGDWLILTSDHGEEFHEHEQWQHGRSLFEEMVHVPLLIVGPQAPEGQRFPEPVGLIDVLPTVAAVTGGEPDFPIHGRNLLAAPDGQRNGAILTHRPREQHPIWGLRTLDKKLIWVMDGSRRVELAYDLANDPLEQTRLTDTSDEAWGELRRQLIMLMETSGDLGSAEHQAVELDPEMARKLGQLGYIDGEDVEPEE